MQTNQKDYNLTESIGRIDEILNSSNNNYTELDYIPAESQLTYSNGFYVNATSLFVDLRDSSGLAEKHRRPVLAKMFRSFISEVIAIVNGNSRCKYIHIDGDCVSAIYDTPLKTDIDSVFQDAAMINSLINILSCKFQKKGYSSIQAGIGIDYGRLLFIKSGYKGSGLNDIAWMGTALNNSAKLSSKASKDFRDPILLTKDIYNNLREDYKNLCSSYLDGFIEYFESNAVNIPMQNWCEDNC